MKIDNIVNQIKSLTWLQWALILLLIGIISGNIQISISIGCM